MRNKFSFFSVLVVIFIFAMSGINKLPAQTVNITMTVNTSTCLDTLNPNDIVIMCGASVKGTVPAITWDTATGIKLTNIGGDYWQTTFQTKTGDTIQYKFVTYFGDLKHPTFHWSGWEGPINPGSGLSGTNRIYIVGGSNISVQLQYFNGWENTVPQYWVPFQVKTDTLAVYFRVNMGAVSGFDPKTQTPEVWGSDPLGAANPWVKIIGLTREINSVDTSFWSGAAYVAKSLVTAGAVQSYKFVINGSNWENIGNRSFTFSTDIITKGDTTVLWKYFNNQPPTGHPVTGNVNFRLRLDALEKAHLFNRGLGDKIAVTGAKGWPPSTFNFDTEPAMLKLTFVPSIQEWVHTESFTLAPSIPIVYKYYIAWDSTRIDSTNPNFIRGLLLANGWEEPGVVGGGNRSYNFPGLTDQTPDGDFGATQQFFNSLHPNSVIPTAIQLTFNVDMAPAANLTTNPTNTLFRPGIDTAYIQYDGCLIPITQGKTMYGTDNRIMLTQTGTGALYSATVNLTAPTFYQVCYRITYTSTTGEVENGGGTNYGRRYYQYIVPTNVSGSNVTWPNSFSLAQMSWTQNNLTVETPPNLGTIGAVGDNNSILPNKYELLQNYPNPFNPSTVITYSMTKVGNVKIEVYNVLGKKVTTLVNQVQVAGTHSLVWNSQKDDGSKVTSGVYFLRMQAGSFSEIKKMVLLK
jgi:hypothetical protein